MIEALINKTYFESLTSAKGYEAMKEFANSPLNDKVRFAQGELYFILGDYETAIFKWLQIENETLQQWGKKNCGDAYLHLKKYGEAERTYLTLQSNDKTVQLEKYLGLSNVYKTAAQPEKLLLVYRELVKLDINYRTVYSDALEFFEQQFEYNDAFSLIVQKNEELTNESTVKVVNYFKLDINGKIKFDHILTDFLKRIWEQQNDTFSNILSEVISNMILTERAKEGLVYLSKFLSEDQGSFGKFILEQEIKLLTSLIDALYIQLSSTTELHSLLKEVIPRLTCITDNKEIESLLKSYIGSTNSSVDINVYELNDAFNLYSYINQLASKQKVKVDSYHEYLLQHYTNSKSAIMLVGGYNSGKSTFINSILIEEILKTDIIPTTSAITVIKEGSEESLTEWKDGKIRATSFEQLEQVTTIHHESTSKLSTSLIALTVPNKILSTLPVSFIDTPGFFDDEINTESNPTYDFLSLADEVIVSLTADKPFSRKDKELAEKLLSVDSTINLSFLLNQVDRFDEDELEEVVEDIERKIQKSFGSNHVLNCYSSYEEDDYRDSIIHFLQKSRTINVNQRIRKMLPSLQGYIENAKNDLKIQLSDQFKKLNASNKVSDTFKDFVTSIESTSNRVQLSNNINNTLINPILAQLRAQIISIIRQREEDIDYHLRLQTLIEKINVNINMYVYHYIKNQAFPYLQQVISNWYNSQRQELNANLEQLKMHSSKNLEAAFRDELKMVQIQYSMLENKLSDLLQKLSAIMYTNITFIDYDTSTDKWLSGVGKLIGVQNNKEYLKIDKLRERLLLDSFDQQISQIISEYEYHLVQFQNEFVDISIQPCLTIEKILNKQLKDLQQIVQNEALIFKNLKDSYPEKIDKWELAEAKVKQLCSLYCVENEVYVGSS